MRQRDLAEKRREEVIKERDQKIKNIMQRMGDVVIGNKDQQLQKKAEREYINECIAKDEAAKKQDIQNKLLKKKKNKEILGFLDGQVNEKGKRKQQELDVQKAYIQRLKQDE